MYIPNHYRINNLKRIYSFIKEYSFGVLVSTDENGQLIATHLPFLIEMKDDNFKLKTHVAKANAQWKNFNKENKLLIIFSEPHSYISPKNYIKKENVPTWNYAAVHLYGNAKIIETDAEKFNLLEETIVEYEKEYLEQWAEINDDYKNKMAKGIVAFEIEITEIQAKYKLSQNKKDEEIKSVIKSLDKSGDSVKTGVSKLMKDLYKF